jgi:hypothetical protein
MISSYRPCGVMVGAADELLLLKASYNSGLLEPVNKVHSGVRC